jgi:hypothetical protein
MSATRFAPSLAAGAFALLAAIPVPATPVATSYFSLTFPDAWRLAPPGPTEMPAVVLDSALDVTALFTVTTSGHPLAFADLKAPAASFSHGDSVAKVSEDTVRIGGRKFLFAQYEGPGNAPNRLRAYYDLYDSTHLFCAFLDYLAPQGEPDTSVFATALGTLRYPGEPVRLARPARARPGTRPDRARAGSDALGRPRARGAATPRMLPPR